MKFKYNTNISVAVHWSTLEIGKTYNIKPVSIKWTNRYTYQYDQVRITTEHIYLERSSGKSGYDKIGKNSPNLTQIADLQKIPLLEIIE